MRWLHLSDFHTGKDHYGQQRLFGAIISHIRERVDRGMGPDLVFLTGDLANRGKSSEYEKFVEEFLVPLSDIVGMNRVFAVPGNHDVDRSAAEFVEAHSLLRRAPRLFDPDRGGASQRANLLPRFEQFREWDLTRSGTHWLDSEQGSFSETLSIDGMTVGVVGVNTAWLSEDDNDRHRLTPGIALLEDALGRLAACDVKFVLGHHPVDWFADEEIRPIESILARAGAIYLHGHLHRSTASSRSGAGRQYLSLQSGAAFQARDSDEWVNGFLWALMEPGHGVVSAEPLTWSRDHREWRSDGNAFPEAWRRDGSAVWDINLPENPPAGTRSTVADRNERHIPGLELSEGWQHIDREGLEKRRQPVAPEEMVRFFDGRVPRWAIALSPDIPARQIVSELVESVSEGCKEVGFRMTLLLAAGGEGKSTALLQSAAAALEQGAVGGLIWHHDTQTRLVLDNLLRLPVRDPGWLIVSDDADQIVPDLLRAVEALEAAERRDVHFLLCSRDTDWNSARGPHMPWGRTAAYIEKRLRGLSAEDANAVVHAWSRFGNLGLGRLVRTTRDKAVSMLLDAAAHGANDPDGVFLGAMLQVRVGTEMREHVRALLERLGGRAAPGGRLLDAFAYIAVAHAEELTLLSAPVLAFALGCAASEIRRKVMNPLGEEAAAVAAGQVLLTRHRAIAETAVGLLEEAFAMDREHLLLDLVEAAHRAGREGEFVYERGEWEYLGRHYFDKGNQLLAFRIARAVMDLNADNARFRSHFAHLYRLANQPDEAARVFRAGSMLRQRHRGYYAEWGICEDLIGQSAVSAWLSAVSLSDRTELKAPDASQIRISIRSLRSALEHLHEAYGTPAYSEGRRACASALELIQSRVYAEADAEVDHEVISVVETIERAAQTAWTQREYELPEWVPGPDVLSFRAVTEILRNLAH